MDLQKYCSDDPYRPNLAKPFSVGEFTYATNGHIMVRVPRRDDIPEQNQKLKDTLDRTFSDLPKATFSEFRHKPLPNIPAAELVDCSSCDGRGNEHDCPDCSCTCDECNGSGKITKQPEISTTVRGVIYNLRYFAMVIDLPGLKVAKPPRGERPILLQFEGGHIAIMPRREKFATHVDIELDAAA